MNNDLNEVKNLATRFRVELEAEIAEYQSKGIRGVIAQFPRGACGEASKLLATYLRDNGCGGFSYYWGLRSGGSHAWLEREGLIVDITADQFPDQSCPVIVTKDRSWHSGFTGIKEGTACLDESDGYATPALRQLYSRVVRRIETSLPKIAS